MIHGKQFALLSRPVELEGYQHRTLPDGLVLSWHRDLPMTISPDGETILLGHVWNAYENGEDPARTVGSGMDEQKLLDEENAWCGRYALLSHGIAYTDVTASLPVFYSKEGIASDISFLEKAGNHPRNELQLEGKTKWFPGPATAFEGISRLLPSQSYDYRQKRVSFRNPLSAHIQQGKSYEELKELCCGALVSCAANMHRHFRKARIIAALTGGYDSRLTFAALHRLSDQFPFSAYTLEHDHISREDVENPPLLCRMTNTPYYFGKRDESRYSQEREQAYREHLSGMVLEEDQQFYAYGQYDGLLAPGQTGVLVRSNFFTLAYSSVAQQRAVGERVDLDSFFANYEINADSPMGKAFFAFFNWIKEHPLPISDTNRFYWEQKLACWSAENDRGYDIYDGLIPVQMGNCRDIATMLLYMPEEDKKDKKHQAEMIDALCPEIADVPYSAIKSGAQGKLGKAVEALGKAWKKARKIGLARTLKYYRSKIFSRKK